ncbi:MAG: adenylate/guanylate cyclase domain-containing protein [Deltaproteobacteria bacterium HGW-Deltaproteobacteria-10]|nr:MAG: adenylate/guanylate cyclase domain-containing protein [Deltaproteobacteria bacterium HGW-Deltaproteobacteria-10]
MNMKKMRSLLDISRKVSTLETLDEILAELIEITTTELNADRGTIFLNDQETGELYSRVAQGNLLREIRVLNSSGVAGDVFHTGKSLIISDAYSDGRFNQSIDEKTGYITKSILCVPIKAARNEIIGVAQVLNKKEGQFTQDDVMLLEAIATQAAIALQSTIFADRMKKFRTKEMEFFDVVAEATSEINLGTLLRKVMSEAMRMTDSERSTLFLNDIKTNELYSRIGEGLSSTEIRFPNNVGIAGAVFQSGETINIPHAYADLRFNPSFDKRTGFFTRSILCTPVINKSGKIIGVTQVLNKKGGPFTREDEMRLKAFTAQVAIALENAKLFDDVQNMKNYNEGMLESMSNGVITLNEDGKIITCNTAGLRIMKVAEAEILNRRAEEFFSGVNAWVMEKTEKVGKTQTQDVIMDADLALGGAKLSVNLTILPLASVEKKKLGTMIVIEDISSEKRMKSTMSRYIDPALTDQIMDCTEDFMGGKNITATILFSDIRGFTTLTEELGAQGTVALLNEYFTLMVDCIQKEGGILDKFIGDAIMAAFGIPFPHDDDEDRAVRAAIQMIKSLNDWNRERAGQGKKPVRIGIGLNTDSIVSGNIGSPKRTDYTVIGDGVNLASRLESASKQYYSSILISDNTYSKLKGTYRMRKIDRVVVKGKTEPVSIYEVLDYHTEESFPNMMEVVNNFSHGLACYQKAQWDKAIESFQRALAQNSSDKLSQMYIERCEHMKKNPPDGQWDGIWIMKSK